MVALLFVLALLAALVDARCYCPPQCSFPACSSKSDYRRSSCNDLEAQSECNRANDQVTDMVNSAGRNADLYLEGLLFKNASVTPAQASYLRSKLSEAMEWGKPVGDCANGLTTDTHLATINDICFSMPLFQQCDALAKSVPQYFSNIHNVLSDRLLAEELNNTISGIVEKGKLSPLATEFVQVIKLRDSIQREANKIRCKGYNSTVEIIQNSAGSTSTLRMTVLFLTAIAFLYTF
ncbi:hypothetical protein SDRG_15328 [Saprolegnia diclina VS20]|uniref:Pectinesterase inhibitor domain-containing protein n=1 Tax=Saprolegnia diclina (strain VS20) TaxID=1156394 RepID=T0PX34_SAPDV|nr:hypothetical protein SDRG_15328 [Saprolegnia diclina VS20]EQC26816.1 hypothetical protein SDRG_15328 [Saprolegnia diclina VS20]|eukprot:XP_008619718.1 hypothetical protein SDRG_15328 [Saprolegnia diclina VS20]